MRVYYQFGNYNFATSEIFWVTGPKNRKGRVVDYGIHHVTVAFTATTSEGSVSVGSAGSAVAFGAALGLGTTAIDAGSVSVQQFYDQPADINLKIVAAGLNMPANAKVGLHCNAPTGGTPAGTAQPFMIIEWAD